MIKTKEDLKLYLREDAKRNGIGNNWINYHLRKLCGSEEAHIYDWICHFRKWEYHANNEGLFHKTLARYHEIRTKRIGLRLGIRAKINTIGYGLRIMHVAGGGGCFLNAKKIGNYCGFNSGVLLGNNGSEDAAPVIGDYVAFGPGAKAIGNITIGNNVFVAANSVVVKSLSPNSIWGGCPAKLIKNKNND